MGPKNANARAQAEKGRHFSKILTSYRIHNFLRRLVTHD